MANSKVTSPWLKYVRARYPVGVYLLLSSGYVLTGWSVTHGVLSAGVAIYGMACFMLFFFTLRLMDEVKDHYKDVIAHPERPLPSGMLTRAQAQRGITVCMVAMLALSAIGAAMLSLATGLLFLLVSTYLWLMYKEFYIGNRLQLYPMEYAISHQAIGIPMIYFAASLFAAGALGSHVIMAASLLTVGAFFCYEVCRKLDPAAHLVLRTYLSIYGRPRTILIAAAAEAVAGAGAYWLGVPLLFWTLQALVVVSFLLPPQRYKITETLATLGLLVHLLGLPILRAFGVFNP